MKPWIWNSSKCAIDVKNSEHSYCAFLDITPRISGSKKRQLFRARFHPDAQLNLMLLYHSISSLEFMPGLGKIHIQRTQVPFQSNSIIAFKIFGYSPRVRTDTASAIFKLTFMQGCTIFVNNREGWIAGVMIRWRPIAVRITEKIAAVQFSPATL